MGITSHRLRQLEAEREALNRSQAIIEFAPDGTILTANENFLGAIGYALDEIRGKHHRMFVDATEVTRPTYKVFWEELARGEYQAAEYKRYGKGGKEIWIQASYNPILDKKGRVVKVVKYATDVTAEKLKHADSAGQIAAVNKAQAVIHFALDGTILDANQNFLNTVGYALPEIQGKHHRIFVPSDIAQSPEYHEFWAKLAQGAFDAGEYKRVGKGDKEIWLQASYNPIMDMNGRPFKVVKYATDITGEKMKHADNDGQLKAIHKSQAVIEFAMDGTILGANGNFLQAVGYELDEIQGKHHRLFVEPAYALSHEYEQFWERLRAGEYQAAEYKRYGKGGREIWIQATYNPIFDMNGKPFKVVKYATDITPLVYARRDVSHSSQRTLVNVQTVAAAAEELTASIGEIAKNTSHSRMAVQEIMDKAHQADEFGIQLQRAAQGMDGIVQLIETIAGQINLLSLNATIESARAGEAGKGFAVVAGEVKTLANQTSSAIRQISDEIQSVQHSAVSVISVLGDIGKEVQRMTELVNSTASAIDEQDAVTKEISANMQTAACGVASIDEMLSRIAHAA
jgi:methyl-accepting chemotaxis protein